MAIHSQVRLTVLEYSTALQATIPVCSTSITTSVCPIIAQPITVLIRLSISSEYVQIFRNNPYELPRMPSVDRLISPDKSNATVARRIMESIFNISVTQLSNWLKAIHKHHRDRLKKRQAGILGKVDRRLHANTHFTELKLLLQDILNPMAEQQVYNKKQ
ncbi:1989_t:CDS:2 [Funneliformis mosseae]|uniref:1989_t:CDS:1 n=1 Tax=Funneliformis mosseae TaxID=27381 RepID=A0A9N9H4W0_FUNMO|nr:1989_t:CDS:2 [Funneliformis mosseae]